MTTEKPKVNKKSSSSRNGKSKELSTASLVPLSPDSSVKLEAGTTSFIGLDKKKYKIEFRPKLFCEYYLQNKGSGPDAIIQAGYDVNFKDRKGNDTGIPNRRLASAMAYENLTKPHVIAYINKRLEEYGFVDENVERQHLFLINQYGDLNVKAKGIDMYYKLKNRYPSPLNKDLQTPVEIEEAILYIRRILPPPAI